jgi:hypothetical protein
MIRHITFCTPNMSIAAEKCSHSAMAYGCDETNIFTPELIDDTFWAFNQEIFTQDRGYGYWLWKPYFIYLNLLQMKEGDTLFYTDAGVEFVNQVDKVLSHMDSDVFLFGNNYEHDHWCKSTVNYNINGILRLEKKQAQASAMIFNNCLETRMFVKDWLMWCQMSFMIDDSESWGNHPEFQEHRHDQAILTCLAVKNLIKLHWWPAMYNGGQFVYDKGTYTDTYPVIFHHHRKRDHEWT